MFSLLKVPAEKLKGRLIEDVKARVTSLRGILGREVAYEEAARGPAPRLRRGLGRRARASALSALRGGRGPAPGRRALLDAEWNCAGAEDLVLLRRRVRDEAHAHALGDEPGHAGAAGRAAAITLAAKRLEILSS